MPDPSTTVLKLSNFPPTLRNVPPLWTTKPQIGKISLLWESNFHDLYHKFSPYTNYKDSLLSHVLPDKQPFVYTFIDEAGQGLISQLPDTVKALAATVNITQGTVEDVLRISKYMISSWGVQFVGTQFALQRLQPFDETRLYNPLSPLLATVTPLTLGLGQPPARHIEGGLAGLANSVTSTIGINMQMGYSTPSSTVGSQALSDRNTGQGKGLVRGADATKGLATFQSQWKPSTTKTGFSLSAGLSSFADSAKAALNQFFGSPSKSPGTFRADETGYLIMTQGATNLNQPWYGVRSTTFGGGPPPTNKSTLGAISQAASNVSSFLTNALTNPLGTATAALSTAFPSSAAGAGGYVRTKMFSFPAYFKYIPVGPGPLLDSNSTGYTVSGDQKYGDVVGQVSGDALTNSDMLVQYAYFVDTDNKYPTKLNDLTNEKAKKVNDNLTAVLKSLNNGTYNAMSTTISNLLPNGMSTNPGFDKLSNQPSKASRYSIGAIGEYYAGSGVNGTRPKSIDAFVRPSPDNLRMSTAFLSDGINMLGILPKNRSTVNNDGTYANLAKVYPNWTVWEPEKDDLIAFYFYDVVNEKYIPFRATVKAISEGNTAFWDELRFIGRADQLYSYNGFSRTLTFTFNVVISSITELLPSWKKINYMASTVKPSNYTVGQSINDRFNRFIVPPMFMLTIGDLYKYQPIIITSLNVNIPDDAVWETLNENNSQQGWSYLNGTITSPSLGKNYGQLPREVEIAVTCNLLEKERAIVGGSHFGHEPRVDNWESFGPNNPSSFLVSGSGQDIPYLPAITQLHERLVEWNMPSLPNPSTQNSAVTQARTNAAKSPSTSTQPFTLLSTAGPAPYQIPTTTGINVGQVYSYGPVNVVNQATSPISNAAAGVR